MNHQEYQALCSKHPDLTSEGFGVNMTYSNGLSHEEYLQTRRRELEEAFREFSYCVQWLQENHIEDGRHAHYWKDRVQTDCRSPHTLYFYIPRGAFILAAHYCGLTVRKMDGSADAWINNPKEVAR